jgi:hypothetical protein
MVWFGKGCSDVYCPFVDEGGGRAKTTTITITTPPLPAYLRFIGNLDVLSFANLHRLQPVKNPT